MKINMRNKLNPFIVAYLLPILAILLIASPILAVVFTANILVINTSTTDYGEIGVRAPLSVSWMASHNYISANGTDVQVELGGTPIPRMLHENYVYFADNVTAGQSDTFELSTNKTLADFDIISGYNGYFYTSDNTNLEITTNGTMEWSGYINTAAGENKTIASHYDTTNGGVKIFVSPIASQNVTARITANPFSSTANITPNAEGTLTQLTPSAGANYQCVDDPIGTPDDAATTVKAFNHTPNYWDTYNLPTPTFLGTLESVVINSVTIIFRVYEDTDGGYATPTISLGSASSNGTERATTNTWTTWSENLTRPGGGTWTYSDFIDLQAGIGLRNTSPGNTFCTQVYLQINYSGATWTNLTVAGIPSGEYLTRFTANGTNMWLSVGSSNSANVSVVSIPNATGNWVFCSANTTPYVNYYKHYVNGVLQAWYQPNSYIIGTTLPDRSVDVNNNYGTFVFGANPTGVSANFTSFEAVSDEIVVGTQVVTPDSTDIVTAPENMSHPDTEMTMTFHIFYFMIAWLSAQTGIDIVMIWWWLSAALAIVVLVLVRRILNNIWLAGGLATAVSGMFVAMGNTLNLAGALEFWIPAVILIATIFVGSWLKTSEI